MKLCSVEEMIISGAFDQANIALSQHQRVSLTETDLGNIESPNAIVARAIKAALDQHGYCIVKNDLT